MRRGRSIVAVESILSERLLDDVLVTLLAVAGRVADLAPAVAVAIREVRRAALRVSVVGVRVAVIIVGGAAVFVRAGRGVHAGARIVAVVSAQPRFIDVRLYGTEDVPGDRVHVLRRHVIIAVLVEVIIATTVLIDPVIPDLYRVRVGVLCSVIVVAVATLTEAW